MPAMNKVAPFLWFNDNAEEVAEFYLSVFPQLRRALGHESFVEPPVVKAE
jgi:predicted 3-demethylubiquinone-9 3-methyltransferase (glyoxalase superfamily)